MKQAAPHFLFFQGSLFALLFCSHVQHMILIPLTVEICQQHRVSGREGWPTDRDWPGGLDDFGVSARPLFGPLGTAVHDPAALVRASIILLRIGTCRHANNAAGLTFFQWFLCRTDPVQLHRLRERHVP